MPTPAEIAALPTTPGSIVRASAAFSPRMRAWTLGPNRYWRDDCGNCRPSSALRDVQVLFVTEETERGGVA